MKTSVAVFLVALVWPLAVFAESMVDVIAQVKPSVVGIGTHHPTGRPQNDLLGTGFAVGDGNHILTAAHVPDSRKIGRKGAYLAVFVGEGEDAAIRRATVVARDTAHDMALLEIDGAPLPTLALDGGPMRPDGTAIGLTGFPIGAVYGLYPASHRGMIAAAAPLARPQVSPSDLTADMIRALSNQLVAYQLDATSFPGNSGGPVYDARTGVVIGVVNSTFVQGTKEASLDRPSGITFAMPIRHGIDLMRANGLRP